MDPGERSMQIRQAKCYPTIVPAHRAIALGLPALDPSGKQ